jgi:CRISPR-associated protein Csy1
VGFASAFFRDGTAGRYFERWITDLPRDLFEVYVYHLVPGLDALGRRIADRADHLRHFPRWRPSQIAPHIRADALDVLVYPEVGMAAVTFALAASRLAPLQCAGWGHPVTTGLPTIDVFFSSACMEPLEGCFALLGAPRDASRHGNALCGARPRQPWRSRQDRAAARRCAASCARSRLFKIHPENDALFARVLDAVSHRPPRVYEGRDAASSAKFKARPCARGHSGRRASSC